MIKNKFKEYLKYEKRYSQHTVEAYVKDIAQFSSFIESLGIEHLFLVDNAHVRLWIVELVEQKNKASSMHRKLSSLNTYYKYLLKRNEVKSNPAKGVQLPKRPQRLPKFIEHSPIQQILDKEEKQETFQSRRDKLVVELLYNTGIRRQELITLQWKDIDEASKRIRVWGKGNKERWIPISSKLLANLSQYREKVESDFGEVPSAVILTNKGKVAYPGLIYRIVNRELKGQGVQTQKSPHVIRHTFATHLLNEGAPLNDIKELLGHASLASTQIYTHNSIEKLKEVFKRSHPKA